MKRSLEKAGICGEIACAVMTGIPFSQIIMLLWETTIYQSFRASKGEGQP